GVTPHQRRRDYWPRWTAGASSQVQGERPFQKPSPRLLRAIKALDAQRTVKSRTEQAIVRKWLLAGRTHCACRICGHDYPAELLVAAHIKPRAECTQAERDDIRSN